MQVSEAGGCWRETPKWIEYLITCGFLWGERAPGKRRIGIISMPCESPAAGLVALGAMRRRLAVAGANDSVAHFQRLERLAEQHDIATFLRNDAFKGRFFLEGRDERGFVWVRGTPTASSKNGPPRIAVLRSQADGWRFDGEAPMQSLQGAGLPHRSFYEHLMEGAPPLVSSNLCQSDSATCLAGRVAGESICENAFASIRFKNADYVAALPNLLTVQRWSPGTISRVTFFNTRTGQIDRPTGSTRLVVADGDAALLKVIDATQFRDSDVLGVIHRVLERDRLESIGIKISDLAQWYAPDIELLSQMSPAPKGITISTLKRR